MLKATRRPRSLADLARAIGADGFTGDAQVSAISFDHREVREGDLFAALPGLNRHGADFALEAAVAGASAFLTDPTGRDRCAELGLPVLVVDDPRSAMGLIAAELQGHPHESMLTVGVTGTNGKTTTSHFIAAALEVSGYPPLLVGTVGSRLGSEEWPATRTTPEAPDLISAMAGALERGGRALVTEVSSHALVLGRVDGIKFDVAVFTNLTQDHLDFHQTMDSYYEAKASLFTAERSKRAVICVDDEWGRRLASDCAVPHVTYSVSGPADWSAEGIETLPGGQTAFTAHGPEGLLLPVVVGVPGDFNVANALAAIAASAELGLHLPKAAGSLEHVTVPGRMERVSVGQDFVALVDYAHTPDAVERALAVGRTCASGRLIAVLGCGGDRDRGKRGPMGAAAGRLSDVVIVTDDNPRSESPSEIRAAILVGAREGEAVVLEIGNRLEAIHRACSIARPGDCVIVLGKGHESGQEVAGVVTPFDDRKVMAEAISAVFS